MGKVLSAAPASLYRNTKSRCLNVLFRLLPLQCNVVRSGEEVEVPPMQQTIDFHRTTNATVEQTEV